MKSSIIAVLLVVAGAVPASGSEPDRNLVRDAGRGLVTVAGDVGHVLAAPLRLDGGGALRLGAVAAVTGLIYALDEDIHRAVQRNADAFPVRPLAETGHFLDPLGYGSANVYYFGGLGVSYLADWDTGEAAFGQILTSFAVYGLLKRPVESVVGRARPYEGRGSRSFGNDQATSFFSGHTVNIFQLATVASHHVDRTWFDVLAFGGAAGVAVQRIEADAHWPSDVFLSAVFAVAVTRRVIALHEERGLEVAPHAGPGGTGLAVGWRF